MDNVQLYNDNFINVVKNIGDCSIDLVVIDPPYKVISGGNSKGLSYKHKGSITEKNDGKIFKHNNIKISDWIGEVYRVLKDESHCYIMTNVLNLEEML